MPLAVGSNVLLYLGQLLRDVLVHLHLLVHVEGMEPVIDHHQCADIIEFIAAGLGQIVPDLYSRALTGTKRRHAEQVVGLEFGGLQEFLDHVGWHVAIDGIDDAYFVGLELQLAVL